ncbi:MAG: hypothetical protein HYV42_03870 [Candidatus Magasanikbacteria bacterium]|nr:hypothetical protein [Candidatus Magasanikbacteria bacterium]
MTSPERPASEFARATGYESYRPADYRARLRAILDHYGQRLAPPDIARLRQFIFFSRLPIFSSGVLYNGLAIFNRKFFGAGIAPLELELDPRYGQLQQSGDEETLIKQLRELDRQRQGQLQIQVAAARHPYQQAVAEALGESVGESESENKDVSVDLVQLLAADRTSYQAVALPDWAAALPEADELWLTGEHRAALSYWIGRGFVPHFFPPRRVQLESLLALVEESRPEWIENGASRPTAPVEIENNQELADLLARGETFGIDLPDQPYLLLFAPSAGLQFLNRSNNEQHEYLAELQGRHLNLGTACLTEYLLEQQFYARHVREYVQIVRESAGAMPRRFRPFGGGTETRFLDARPAGGFRPAIRVSQNPAVHYSLSFSGGPKEDAGIRLGIRLLPWLPQE